MNKKNFTLILAVFGLLFWTAEAPFGQTRARVASLIIEEDESEREDKFTNGRIERAPLEAGNPNIRVTVDVPSFVMTLWQGDKEITKYYVGVGKKDYPISIGERVANEIVLNPDWIPPDSDWVNKKRGVKAFEVIKAKDPRNPLGKIKIPLGYGYLLHEAAGAGDLGSLVSHGCVRVMRTDIYDLSKKIAIAYGLPTAAIDKSRTNKTQRFVKLPAPLAVDINYDTITVENGVLNIYPDVYERGTNTVERLRAELKANEVDDGDLSDATIKKMFALAKNKRKFSVSLTDVKNNRSLTKGRTLAVVPARRR